MAGTKELTNFNHLFWKKTRKNLTDSHIWFSVVNRPRTSRFTRVQRLTCCLCLLFTSMMASILFYKTEPSNSVVIPFLYLSMVNLQGIPLIKSVFSVLLILIFSRLVLWHLFRTEVIGSVCLKYHTSLKWALTNRHQKVFLDS